MNLRQISGMNSIGQSLQSVILSNNRDLSDIGDIGELTLLNSLILDGCRFVKPPAGLEQLNQLHLLNFCWNCSLTVAPSLRGVSMLRSLLLWRNRLQAAPDGLESATSLRYLDLSNNSIATMPNLSRLTQLRVLHIVANRLTHSIEGLDQLPLLQAFKGCSNRCAQLIQEISPAQRTSLRLLWLSDVAHVLPLGLTECVNLQCLDVSAKQS